MPLLPSELKASNGSVLTPQADSSVVASGKNGVTVYTLKARTDLRDLTGLRLEALKGRLGVSGHDEKRARSES